MSVSAKDIIEDFKFLSLKELEQMLQQSSDTPYTSIFSMDPYIEEISGKMCNACDVTKSAIMPILQSTEKEFSDKKVDEEEMMRSPEIQTLMSMAVPSLLFSNELSYISPPYTKKFYVKTPSFNEFLESDEWEAKINANHLQEKDKKLIIQVGIQILNDIYGQDIPKLQGDLFAIRNKKTKLVKYYSMNFKSDFINVETKGKIPELSQNQIDQMLNNPDDIDLWMNYLPPENFILKGFCIGNLYEVTDIQVLSDLKHWLSYADEIRPDEFKENLAYFIQSYLNKPDIEIGNVLIDSVLNILDTNISLTGYSEMSRLFAKQDENKGIYDHLLTAKRVLYIEDLNKLENPSRAEWTLIQNNIQSIVISPILNENAELIAFLEIGSKNPGSFNSFNVNKLQDVFNQLNMSFLKFNNQLNNKIASVIQDNFTSIHSSVSWKFEEVAKEYFARKQSGKEDASIAPIVFNDIFPLYGQSDIINSTVTRNNLVKEDLMKNLFELTVLLENWSEKKKLHVLEAFRYKIKNIMKDLEKEFISSDESRIVSLITKDIHPLIEQSVQRYPELNDSHYKNYISLIDPSLKIIYDRRREFERSVNRLNSKISEYIEKEEKEMQKVLPHFFEKYKTDGVEYNLYLGNSLLQNEIFLEDDLRNFKIWQLETSCEITRLVHDLSPELEIPLKTSELIFVYNHPLSIRFRMDEKKFDVDGAYNVRYEILKKRIDKATIKKTNERLTVAGKVAIVYLNENDRQEYLEFFEYLKAKKLITDDIEQLELNDLQGAEGLHALRVTVNTNQ